MMTVPIDVRAVRKATGYTQEAFAGTYRIPIGTVRDWEQGRREPDQGSRVLLSHIQHAPDTIGDMLVQIKGGGQGMIGLFMLASFVTGNVLNARCAGDEPDQYSCLSYIVGVADAAAFQAKLPNGPKLFCLPDGVVQGQLQDVVRNFLRDHPETRQGGAGGIVLFALRQGFPCSK